MNIKSLFKKNSLTKIFTIFLLLLIKQESFATDEFYNDEILDDFRALSLPQKKTLPKRQTTDHPLIHFDEITDDFLEQAYKKNHKNRLTILEYLSQLRQIPQNKNFDLSRLLNFNNESLNIPALLDLEIEIICRYNPNNLAKNNISALLKELEYRSKKGIPASLWILGNIYLDNQLIPPDYKKAIDLFQQSADQDYPPAQVSLASCIIKENSELSFTLFKSAAHQGNVQAQKLMAMFYETGYCVEKDINAAIHWYQLAAERGLISAQMALEKLYIESD